MKISKNSLRLIIEQFLSEEDENESKPEQESNNKEQDSSDSEEPELDTIVVKQDNLSIELREENGNHNIYVNGAMIDDTHITHQKKPAIIAKAFKDLKFDIASNDADQGDAENILLWADVGIQGGRKSLIATGKNAKHRLAVNWNAWVEELTSKF